jgi:hypothetical protein
MSLSIVVESASNTDDGASLAKVWQESSWFFFYPINVHLSAARINA